MNELQLALILAWYYFEKASNVSVFANRFNQYFGKDHSAQTLLFSSAKFKNVDPANNTQSNSQDERYSSIWTKYITSDRIKELKDLYREFKKGSFANYTPDFKEDDYFDIEVGKHANDEPLPKPIISEHTTGGYTRSKEVVSNVLFYAGYQCELKCSTKLFLRKNSKINYTEAHHLIPLCYQDAFEYSLDVEANVISLCPNCHRQVHYGEDISDLLRILYDDRKERLKKCGIKITFAQLQLMYR